MRDDVPSGHGGQAEPALDYWPERHLTPSGFLAAGADVDSVLASGTEQLLVAVWATYRNRTFLQAMYDGSYDNTRDRNEFSAQLAELAPVTALQALDADARLTRRLGEHRWEMIRNAREGGAGWGDIAVALGLSEQVARNEYERAIAEREQRLPDRPKRGGPIPTTWHDVERARAVLDDPPTS